MLVIGDFRHATRPNGAAIYVSMFWGDSDQRLARIVVPEPVRSRLETLDYPSIDEDMGIEAALSYAVFVGMRVGLGVVLTGDSSVWNPEWGRLYPVNREPAVSAVNRATLN